MQEKVMKIFFLLFFGRLAWDFGKLPDGAKIGLLRPFRCSSQLQILQQSNLLLLQPAKLW
jgi:hypothetical protein